MCKVVMEFDKETKATIRFKEVVAKDSNPVIGVCYVPKATLNIMGYEEGDSITFDIGLQKGEAPEKKAVDPAPAEAPKRVKKEAVKADAPAKAPAKRRGRPKKATA